MTADRNEATEAQVRAADPGGSTWLSANAGSGKTRVLTDRVARLLLKGVDPQQILCLTYTKAAASEMQNRLFKRLGSWSMLSPDQLRQALFDLGEDEAVGDKALAHARTLFARAIETPGGLKIQTIHSFCASLLRRFPLEAGVSPLFEEMDERTAELLQSEIVEQMASGADASFVGAVAVRYTGSDFSKLLQTLVRSRAQYATATSWDDICAALGLQSNSTLEKIAQSTLLGGEADLVQRVVPILAGETASDAKIATALANALQSSPLSIDKLSAALLSANRSKVHHRLDAKRVVEALGESYQPLHDLAERLVAAEEQRRAFCAADQSWALTQFAERFLHRYAEAKQLRGWLDFDDLIYATRALLSRADVAAWVLYRLDGGVRHLLVDEAQDTSPVQWDVIRLLLQEFTSGAEQSHDAPRTMFVVGDKKQSIYSFQGAVPDAFDEMEREFGTKLQQVGAPFQSRSLAFSFRSSAAILQTVDATFETEATAGFSPDEKHRAFHGQKPGRVDLWPLLEPVLTPEDPPWIDPIDRLSETHHTVQLAKSVAEMLAEMLNQESPAMIPDGDDTKGYRLRAVQPGDIMILVQSRSTLFKELIRACKSLNLPIAGADRLRVGAELAVRDLMALMNFLVTPEDDLSLAVALRSPLFGWSEQDVFTLAHHRKEAQLWERLRNQRDVYPKTFDALIDLRNQIDFLRPYELLERILTRHSGRQKLLGRLGSEAEDGIDAILAQALTYEANNIPSLTGFLSWAQADDLEIKRQIETDADLIRVMTVHGAKGLEAPIVILPDCASRKLDVKDEILNSATVPLWRVNASDQPAAMASLLEARKDADQNERKRLLYVAMTRAETWLIVAGAGQVSKDGSDWHSCVADGMHKLGAATFDHPTGPGLRLEHGCWTVDAAVPALKNPTETSMLEPFFNAAVETFPARDDPLSPSDLGGAKALPSELGQDELIAKARGTYMHLMLEAAAKAENAEQACRDIPVPSNLLPRVADAALGQVLRVFNAETLRWIFDPNGLSEASLAGQINGVAVHGIVDRLIVSPTTVHVIDFKTNQAVPKSPEECPEGLLRQMGAYARLLKDIYPDRSVETGILWTAETRFMSLPQNMVMDALARAARLDGHRVAT